MIVRVTLSESEGLGERAPRRRRDDQGLAASRSIGAWVGDLRAQEGPLIFARANAA